MYACRYFDTLIKSSLVKSGNPDVLTSTLIWEKNMFNVAKKFQQQKEKTIMILINAEVKLEIKRISMYLMA